MDRAWLNDTPTFGRADVAFIHRARILIMVFVDGARLSPPPSMSFSMGEVPPLRLHRRGCSLQRTGKPSTNGERMNEWRMAAGARAPSPPPSMSFSMGEVTPNAGVEICAMQTTLNGVRGRRGCSDNGFGNGFHGFGFKTPAGGLCAWAVQSEYTPPGELPVVRQFATLPTWRRSLRSLCHVEREKTPFPPPSMSFSMGEVPPLRLHRRGCSLQRTGKTVNEWGTNERMTDSCLQRDGLRLPGSIHAFPLARPLQNPCECRGAARKFSLIGQCIHSRARHRRQQNPIALRQWMDVRAERVRPGNDPVSAHAVCRDKGLKDGCRLARQLCWRSDPHFPRRLKEKRWIRMASLPAPQAAQPGFHPAYARRYRSQYAGFPTARKRDPAPPARWADENQLYPPDESPPWHGVLPGRSR